MALRFAKVSEEEIGAIRGIVVYHLYLSVKVKGEECQHFVTLIEVSKYQIEQHPRNIAHNDVI